MPRKKRARQSAAVWWPRSKVRTYLAWARDRDPAERAILHAEGCPCGDGCDCTPITLYHGASA